MRKFKQRNLVAHIRKFSLESCFTALFMALCISACSDDDDAAKVVFPEKQTVNPFHAAKVSLFGHIKCK